TARFRQPIYEGDEVSIAGTSGSDGEVMTAELEARNEKGEVCAVAAARLGADRPEVPSLDAYPAAAPPTQPHEPTPEALADLDVLLVADGLDPVMHVHHRAIYRLRSGEHGE